MTPERKFPCRVTFITDSDRNSEDLWLSKSEFDLYLNAVIFGKLDPSIRRVVLGPRSASARRIVIDLGE